MRCIRSSLLALVLALPPTLLAQTRTDVIRGHVATDSGVVVSGASIIVTRAPDRASFQGSSDAQGNYQVLIPDATGDYLVHISAIGRTAFRKRVTRTGTDTVFVVDAKLVGPMPESRERRLTRSTSPPIVVGSTFATNWPAR